MFSGGKDSTASLIIALEAIKAGLPVKRLDVVLADTLVEIPTVAAHASQFLDSLSCGDLVIHKHIVKPELEESFWVCMLGKGYPPPHRNFRWCTSKLKIKPTEAKLAPLIVPGRTVFITGVRFGESDARDIRLHSACSRGGECGQGLWFERSGKLGVSYAGPISVWRECDVWDLLNYVAPSWGYSTSALEKLYLFPSMRFGCWTCTVVRRDKAMESICAVPEGRVYEPLLRFRQRLIDVAAESANRVMRLNGVAGRLTIATRQALLVELLAIEDQVGMKLLLPEEEGLIRSLWTHRSYQDAY